MPQLDKVTFLSQFFWLCIVFCTMYLLLVKVFLPALARIVKVRNLLAAPAQETEMQQTQKAGSVYGTTVQASAQAFEKRADFLQNWSSKNLTQVLPTLSKQFQSTLLSIRQESLLSENLLLVVVPPLDSSNTFQDENHLNWLNAKANQVLCTSKVKGSVKANKKA